MNDIRLDKTTKFLEENFSNLGWSVNETKLTLMDKKLNRKHSYYLLTQHPHKMIVLVVEINDNEQQQLPDFYEQAISELFVKNNYSLKTIAYITFNNADEIVQYHMSEL